MTTHGSLSIERPSTPTTPWTKADTDAYLTTLALGILAGLAVTYLRTPLHMPGHKALLWIIPTLTTKLLTRTRLGTSVALVGTTLTASLLGGRIGGGLVMMPLVVVAGLLLDIVANSLQRYPIPFLVALPFLALAGAAASLLTFIKRLFEPVGQLFSTGNLTDLLSTAASYALFGLLAGAISLLLARLLTPNKKQRDIA